MHRLHAQSIFTAFDRLLALLNYTFFLYVSFQCVWFGQYHSVMCLPGLLYSMLILVPFTRHRVLLPLATMLLHISVRLLTPDAAAARLVLK